MNLDKMTRNKLLTLHKYNANIQLKDTIFHENNQYIKRYMRRKISKALYEYVKWSND